jgi:hypothetical protein
MFSVQFTEESVSMISRLVVSIGLISSVSKYLLLTQKM